MDDSLLREELTAFGVNVGPINDGTRETYMRVLAKKKGGSSPSRSSRKSLTSKTVAKTLPPKRNSSPAAARRPSPPPTPPQARNVSPRQIPVTRRVSPPSPVKTPPQQHYRVSPRQVPPRKISPPTRLLPPHYEDVSPPQVPSRRMSPPSQKQSLYNRVSPRQIPPTRRVSPPTPVHTPPQQHYRVSPRPQPQVPSQFSSSNSFRKIDFDDSAQHEDDDDHMEFSKYIPNKKPKRTKNVAFQINPTFITGIAFTICVFAYLLYPDKIHSGINTSSNYLNSAIMAGFKYAIMPFLVLGVIFAVGCAIYYGFQAHSKSKAIYEEKKKKMIKEILKAVYNAPANGIAVKQLRDKMIPAYDRTKDELNLWNVCEDFVKTYETRVRAEERTNAKGDEEVEHFVWVASTLNQDLEDD